MVPTLVRVISKYKRASYTGPIITSLIGTVMSKNKPTKHSEVIQSSWDRCRSYGLEHATEPELIKLSREDTGNIREEYRSLINTTDNEVLPYYENILSNTQCLILLTDSQGQVLNSWGDKRFIDLEHKTFFEQGVDWKEQTLGTNAIGTALNTGQAVQVQRDEHFLKTNRFMIGSAAPIYNVNQDLLGVLDVSSDTYLPQAHTLGMVKLMSQSVENRLIINMFCGEHYLLTFNTNLDNIDSQWSGLIVFNEEGTIISANRRAELILNYDLALTNVTDIFDYPLRELKSHPELLPLSLPTLGKYKMHGVIKGPTQKVIKAVDFREQQNTLSESPEDVITLDRLSFGDDAIQRHIRQAQRVIEKDIPILILGETGVGKEVFVSALHEYSSRNKYPLVPVNCAAIPSELVESELFGYEKGAFTGASNKGAIGLIRKAHKGTLFLDEIGEMPLKVQARLLRVLQERKVTPLGSVTSYPVDIKLISATNCGLKEDVERKQFRQDLYYRVSGLNIELPPLRKRTDKRALFSEIHRLYRQPHQAKKLSEDILNLFQQHPWPGNIRQLVSVIQIALAMVDEEPIQSWHLPDDFFADIEGIASQEPPPHLEATDVLRNADVLPLQKSESTQLITGEDVLQAYNQHEGNISRTAKELGMSRNTLYKRLRELGIR